MPRPAVVVAVVVAVAVATETLRTMSSVVAGEMPRPVAVGEMPRLAVAAVETPQLADVVLRARVAE